MAPEVLEKVTWALCRTAAIGEVWCEAGCLVKLLPVPAVGGPGWSLSVLGPHRSPVPGLSPSKLEPFIRSCGCLAVHPV